MRFAHAIVNLTLSYELLLSCSHSIKMHLFSLKMIGFNFYFSLQYRAQNYYVFLRFDKQLMASLTSCTYFSSRDAMRCTAICFLLARSWSEGKLLEESNEDGSGSEHSKHSFWIFWKELQTLPLDFALTFANFQDWIQSTELNYSKLFLLISFLFQGKIVWKKYCFSWHKYLNVHADLKILSLGPVKLSPDARVVPGCDTSDTIVIW
jgi:hypothetical protein